MKIGELSQGPGTSVWVASPTLSMICNTSEHSAANLAEKHSDHIYFFAELTPAEV